MAFTLTQLAALEEAIAGGELTVKYDGKETTYRSMRELREAYDFVKAQLEQSGLLSSTPRTALASFSRG